MVTLFSDHAEDGYNSEENDSKKSCTYITLLPFLPMYKSFEKVMLKYYESVRISKETVLSLPLIIWKKSPPPPQLH